MSARNRDLVRMAFGFALLLILAVLTWSIAHGQVEEKSSYGLMPLIVAVSNLATQFASYAFGPRRADKKVKDE